MFYTDYRSVSKVMYALIAVLLLNACGGKQEARDYKFDEAFTPYVSAYTTEKISRQSTIKVRLAQDVVAKDKVGFAMADSPLEFTPSIKGKARWIDRRTIEFEPSDILPSSQFYKASFKIGDFIPALKEEMKVFNFGFETRKQTFEVSVQGLETTDNAKLIWQALNGTLTTADFEHSELVEKLMEAKQDGKSLDIQWAHSIDGREHGFRIEKVKRQEDPSAVELTWNGAPIDVEIDGNQGVPVPALGDFHVLTASAFNNPEQYAVVKFSDPLKKGQNLDGLIRLEGKGLRFVIDGNEVKVYPRSRVTGAHKLKVEPGIRNVLGHKMQDSKEFEIQFEEIKPQVRLVGNGVILPRSGNALPFAFEAASLKSVQLRIKRIYEDNILQFLQVNDLDGSSEIRRVGKEVHFEEVRLDRDKSINLRAWNRHVLDLSKLINAEPGAIYRVELDFGLKNSVYSCDNGDEAEATSESSDDGPEFDDYEEEASYWDNYEDDDDYTSRWENRDNPCHDAYYTYYERGVSRNVLASDLGIISKRGTDGSMVFAVNNLQNTDPMSGVTIELYDFQQQLIASTSTDGDGTAMLKVEDQPHVMIAKQGAQRGYMRLGDGYSLSLSKFDVSGQRYYQGVKGFVYGERGVWRPGDSIFTTVVLEDKLNSLPEAHPVTFTLYNPMGQQVKKATRRNHVNGMYTFHTRTGSSAPTGNYRLNVSVGGASFDKTLKVETVTPNRLKIKIDFGKDYLSKEMESVEGDLSARWLHGAIAGGLKADVGVTLRPAKTSFKRFSDFIFDDPVRSFDSDPQNVFEGELDEQGESKVPLRIS
ncbi:MAG: MG2 domain-containing protein, partial [Bacteroidota bacterium]